MTTSQDDFIQPLPYSEAVKESVKGISTFIYKHSF